MCKYQCIRDKLDVSVGLSLRIAICGVVLAVLWGLFIAVGFFASGAAGLCLQVVLRTDLVVALWLG
jgi:hypothetical protein